MHLLKLSRLPVRDKHQISFRNILPVDDKELVVLVLEVDDIADGEVGSDEDIEVLDVESLERKIAIYFLFVLCSVSCFNIISAIKDTKC